MLNLNSQHMVIILIVFCALVFGMCASITISCWSKIEERRQRKREYKLRRSRETSMEAGLDRTMTITSLDHAAGAGGVITAGGIEHLEQGSSSSGSRCRKIITANQIRAVGGHKEMMLDEDGMMIEGVGAGGPGGGGPTMAFYDSEENGCYVPDMDIGPGGGGGGGRHHHLVYPADHRRPNGGLSYSLEKYSPDTPTPPHHHQTQVVQQQQAQQMLTSPNGQSMVVGMAPREYYQPGAGGGDHGSIRSDSECSIPPPPPPPALSHFRSRMAQVGGGGSVGPQTYRTMPLDAGKLNDGSGGPAGLVMGDNPTLYRHAQHGNMPQRMLHHPGQQGPGLQQQHHPDCAQHQLNKQQHMMQPSADSGYNSNSLRRGTATPTVVSYAYRGTPTAGDVLGPDDIDIMVEEGGQVGGGGGGNGTQAVPGHHRSNLELTDDGLDLACDMFSDSEMIEPGGRGGYGNGRLTGGGGGGGHQQRAPYLMRTQSTMEEEEVEGLDEEESSSMPLAANGGEDGPPGQYTTLTPGHNARPVYYRSEAVIEMSANQGGGGGAGPGPINSNLSSSTSNLRQGVAMMR